MKVDIIQGTFDNNQGTFDINQGTVGINQGTLEGNHDINASMCRERSVSKNNKFMDIMKANKFNLKRYLSFHLTVRHQSDASL